MSDIPVSSDSSPIVFTKRWDKLGARLNPILNAWSVAKALGFEFRFVWPMGVDQIGEASEIFDENFLGQYAIAESDLTGEIIRPDFNKLNKREAHASLRSTSMIEIDECFDILAFADETLEAARTRFRAGLFELGWGVTSLSLFDQIFSDTFLGDYSAIHIRAGDMVIGEWRQFTPAEKYTPSPYIEVAIKSLSGPNQLPVVVVSDNEPYIGYLKTRFHALRRPADIITHYEQLTDMQRALADILLLSRARQIVGPPLSAFSRVGANLAGTTISSADQLFDEGSAKRHLEDGIAVALGHIDRPHALNPILARDICWYLDVFSDAINSGDRLALSSRAVQLDPDFCGALNRMAAEMAWAGEPRQSVEATLRAKRAAAKAVRHADPEVETLATAIGADVLALDEWQSGLPEWVGRLGLGTVARSLGRKILGDTKRSLSSLVRLRPHQIHLSDVIHNLRSQIVMSKLLMRLRTGDTLAKHRRSPLFPEILAAWRPPGFDRLSAANPFPQVLRNVEILTIAAAGEIGARISRLSPRLPTAARVDNITTSASGLCWISGWVYTADTRATELAVGLLDGDSIVTGGPTYIARPDVAEALADSRARRSGFCFPLPMELATLDALELQSKLRIVNATTAFLPGRRPARWPPGFGGFRSVDSQEKRELGKTGLKIAPLVLGGSVFGWTVDEYDSFALLDAFFGAGFNCIDTADAYSVWVRGNHGGESEAVIGRWLKSRRIRNQVIVATKVGWPLSHDRKGLSRAYITSAVEESLKRLQTDYIDLYQSHVDDLETPLEETLGAYSKLIEQGKVREIGASNYGAVRFSEALKISDASGIARYRTLQPPYNLFDRSTFEDGLEQLCEKEEIGVIGYAALANGFLTGKYRSENDLSRKTRGSLVKPCLSPRGFRILQSLDEVATLQGITPAQASLAWLMSRKALTAPIVAATNLVQLREIIGSIKVRLDDAALKILDAASRPEAKDGGQ